MQPNMTELSEVAKPEPTDQQASEKQPGAFAPQKRATESGRLPLFRK
jgi:hypothetical protein